MSEKNIKKELEFEKQVQDEKIKNDWEKSHGRKMISRRDFLNAGLIGGSSYLTLPPLITMFANAGVAQAQDFVCGVSGATEMPALITLNLAGGAGLAGNWMPLDKSGYKLPSYTKLGQGKNPTGITDFANKANFYAGSPFLSGVKQGIAMNTAALSNASFVGLATQSGDDRSTNNFDISGMAYSMGLKGKLLSNLGINNTKTGANILPAFVAPPAPLVVSRYEDVLSALSVSGSLDSLVSKKKVLGLFQTIQKLSNYQVSNLIGANDAAKLQKVLYCATNDNTELNRNASSTNTNPRDNQAFATTWGINANTQTSTEEFKFATLVYNAMNGNAGSANLVLGGYDYHNGTRTTGDTADTKAGLYVGRIIASSLIMNKKTMIIVVTDGAVGSTESELPGSSWTGDRGQAGASYMISVDPAGISLAAKSQLGYFNTAQAADDTSVVGSSADRAALAFIVNYLSMSKKLSQIDTVLPRILTSDEIDKMLVFS